MKQMLTLGALCLLFLAAKCGDTPKEEKGFQVGTPFSLVIQEQIPCECAGPDVKFEGVTEDSRCPKYTNCVWEGQAVVQLTLMGSTPETLELTMQEGKPELASKEVGGYIYRLEAVNPYPEAGKKIVPADYSIRLVVETP
jgi:hypothetical protein